MRSTLQFLTLAAASALAGFAVLMFLFMRYWGLVSVEGVPPDAFPVLLSLPGPTCTVVLWREIEAAKPRTEEWSYLAPVQDLAECESQLRPDFTIGIESVEVGLQRMTVTSSPGGDEVNTSRYKATPDSIEPISHQRYFGPLVALVAAGASSLFGVISGAFGVRFLRRKRADAA